MEYLYFMSLQFIYEEMHYPSKFCRDCHFSIKSPHQFKFLLATKKFVSIEKGVIELKTVY